MSTPGTPTYDQLNILLAIVDTGSFAAAGRKLGRAVSAISYGVANLEAQLGLTLFDREGTRRPKLTEAGRVVLAEARGVAQVFDGLRATVKGLLDGLETATLAERSNVQKLVNEHEMGELFKVVAFGAKGGAAWAPMGFAAGDRSHTL